MNNLYDNPVGLLFYYIYTFIHLYTYNYFFRVRWNNIQIDNIGMVKAMRKGGQ